MPRRQTQPKKRPAAKSAGPLPPSVKRRRRLRRERQRDRLIQVWRLLVFTGSASVLAWILLSAGWTLQSIDQIHVSGSKRLGPDNVAKAGRLQFPLPMLSLEPSSLERRLMAELPVQSVTVQRRLLPPGLEVTFQDRQPIAAATRRGAGETERGMVDREGHWIPLTVARQGEEPASAVRVQGWIPSRRSTIAKLLQKRNELGSPLQLILIAPDGDLSLRTVSLGLIKLGSNGALLDQQLNTVVQLTRSLPAELLSQSDKSLDLTDPSKPELQLPSKPKKKASES